MVKPIRPQITNVNGAQAVHPDSKSKSPMPTAPAAAPDFLPYITAQIKKIAKQPVIMKLTPNVTDITEIAKGAEAGGSKKNFLRKIIDKHLF